jgi:hypothetical protein
MPMPIPDLRLGCEGVVRLLLDDEEPCLGAAVICRSKVRVRRQTKKAARSTIMRKMRQPAIMPPSVADDRLLLLLPGESVGAEAETFATWLGMNFATADESDAGRFVGTVGVSTVVSVATTVKTDPAEVVVTACVMVYVVGAVE